MGIRPFRKLWSFSCVPQLGLFRNQFSFRERCAHQIFRSASQALLPDDSELDYSCPDIEKCSEKKVTVTKRGKNIRKKQKLYPIIGRVLKTLNWRVAKRVQFSMAVSKFGLHHSEDAFKILVHIYAVARMEKEVYSLLRDVVCHYQRLDIDQLQQACLPFGSLNDPSTSVFILNVLVKVFAANKLLNYAAAVFFKAKEICLQLSILSCNFLLKCLAEARLDHLFYRSLEEMKRSGPLPNVYTYTIMIDFYCKGHNLKGEDMDYVIRIMEEMKESPTVVTCSALIHGLCRVGRVECALEFIWSMRQKNEHLNSYSYNAVIHELCKRGENDKALMVLEDMKRFEISPDIHTYSILVDGFCESGDIEKGRSLIKEMKAYNLKPSIVTYTSLLKGFCKRGLLKESLEVINTLPALGGYKCDRIAYNVSINSFCKLGNFDVAYALLEEMISNDLVPDACHVNTLIHWSGKRSSSKKALAFYAHLLEVGVTPDKYTYTILINMFCNENRLDRACDMFNEMIGKGLKPDYKTWTSIIHGFSKLGYLKEASNAFNEMERSGHVPTVVTYTCLIKGYCDMKKMDEAHWLFDKMKRKSVHPDGVTFKVLIRGYRALGQFGKADELFKEMRMMRKVSMKERDIITGR